MAGLGNLLSSDGIAPSPVDGDDIEVSIEGDVGAPEVTQDGIVVRYADGSIEVDFSDDGEDGEDDSEFDANLAEHMGEMELQAIANDLMTGIDSDNQARHEWIETRERAIKVLGLTIEGERTDAGASVSPVEGLSSVRHPVLLQAVLRAQATAAAELLPASGPTKIQIISEATEDLLEYAEALEQDINAYLTITASEYVPDTRRTLFWSSFGGSGFKKVYRCPVRCRPVSEMVDAGDLIVSPGASDLQNAERVTQVIRVRQSVMKRMQVLGFYRDVDLAPPTSETTELDDMKARIEGIAASSHRPEDAQHTDYECYCELDLNKFAPPEFKDLAIPLPYRVTIDKDTRAVLEIRRNWDEDDELALRKKVFVKYPYIEAMGIYGLGLLHVVGNSNVALTGAWRLFLDNCMFANFPSGIVDKGATRQNTNELRGPPGSLIPLDFGMRRASDIFAPLPYRDLGPVAVQFIAAVEGRVERLAGVGELQVGEGRQDAPVGTTVALLEQQTKLETEIHKGLHSAQAEELRLLRDLLRDDPSVLWRGCKESKFAKKLGISAATDEAEQTRRRMFVLALNMCELVPQSDPNVPSHIHRLLKLGALKQVQAGNPNIDPDKVDRMIVRGLGFDPKAVWRDTPLPAQADPAAQAAQMSAQAQMLGAQSRMVDSQTRAQESKVRAISSAGEIAARQRDRESQENIEALRFAREQVIHQGDAAREARQMALDNAHKTADRQADVMQQTADRQMESAHRTADRQADLAKHQSGLRADLVSQRAEMMARRAEAARAREQKNVQAGGSQ